MDRVRHFCFISQHQNGKNGLPHGLERVKDKQGVSGQCAAYKHYYNIVTRGVIITRYTYSYAERCDCIFLLEF